MSYYEDLFGETGAGLLPARLVPISLEVAETLRERYLGIPEDYLQFLLELGWGEVGNENYMMYSGLIDAEEIYPGVGGLAGILLFGDDFCGICAGFDVRTWRVVEIDVECQRPVDIAADFRTFIAATVARIAAW